MAKRIPHPAFRTFAVTIEGAPKGLTAEALEALVRGAVADLGKSATVEVSAPARTAKLRNRHVRKDGRYACTQTGTIGGRIITGCGRTFATEKGLAIHMDKMAGTFSDTRRWPNGCLDAIVPDDLRDDR
ncbi:MAG TPA: hypothetical protein VIV09_16785 [Pseudolabrys sp.]